MQKQLMLTRRYEVKIGRDLFLLQSQPPFSFGLLFEFHNTLGFLFINVMVSWLHNHFDVLALSVNVQS